MELVLRTEDVAVIDGFLRPDALKSVSHFAEIAEYKGVHRAGWRKVWRLTDGEPLQGPTSWYLTNGIRSETSTGEIGGRPKDSVYPTNCGMDAFVAAFMPLVDQFSDLIGAEGVWRAISFAPWIYQQSTGLSMHSDGVRYTGGFAYYLHPEWNIHWGGALVVLSEMERAHMTRGSGVEADEQLSHQGGIGLHILPRPNRLVFIAPDCRHLISRIDPNAGDRSRLSIGGFFHKT